MGTDSTLPFKPELVNYDIVGSNDADTLMGSGNGESINGSGGNDSIIGGGGDDFIFGGVGDDVLAGGAGSDVLMGGEGNDFLNGGWGPDELFGGAGADSFFHHGGNSGFGTDWVNDFSSAEGDRLVTQLSGTADDFFVTFAHTDDRGSSKYAEAFIHHIPSGQVLWALQDAEIEEAIVLQTASGAFDLL